MRIAYFDCFSGASGDMILGACLDAGLSLEELRGDLARLNLPGYSISAAKIKKQGFSATQFEVQLDASTARPHRHLKHIREIIEGSTLSPRVQQDALAVFTRLGEAEAQVHGTSIEKVHFHEVGAIDAIVDVVGACVAMQRLGVDRVVCSPIPTGSGTVRCEHGVMPVPAPATALLLTGVPLAETSEIGELTTPTGAAILTTLAGGYGPCPALTLRQTGMGAGRRDGATRPNVLRILIGDAAQANGDDEYDEVIVLEVNLDDATGELVGYTIDRLLAAGALDAYSTAIVMKKNRPAVQLTVLCPPQAESVMQDILLAETTTLGVRGYRCTRRKLQRTVETVQTSSGAIRIKVALRGELAVKASPEYEDCRAACEKTGRPLREIMDEAMQAWRAPRSG